LNLVSEGISSVRVFKLPIGVFSDGQITADPACVLVRWKSGWEDKLYQIYVNGRFAGSTNNIYERQIKVHLGSLDKKGASVEVFAVDPGIAGIDMSDELSGRTGEAGLVRLICSRSNFFPCDAKAYYYSNDGDGEIDYDSVKGCRDVWGCWQDNMGFGMSRFGLSDFGYDGAAAVGFGNGYFGIGEFGFDCDGFVFEMKLSGNGRYKFGVKVTDTQGNEYGEAIESDEIVFIEKAYGSQGLELSSYDKEEGRLVLRVI